MMMSPRSFLVARQNQVPRASPSTSPAHSPSASPRHSPKASPRTSPRLQPRSLSRHTPRYAPPYSPTQSPPAPSPFSVVPRRNDDDLLPWELPIPSDTPPRAAAAPAAPAAPVTPAAPTTAAAPITPAAPTPAASPAPMTPTSVAPMGPVLVGARNAAKDEAALNATPRAPSAKAPLASDRRPTTPTSPVQIPVKAARHETAHPPKAKHRHRQTNDAWRGARPGQAQAWQAGAVRRPSRDIHSPDAIPPSVAALLAVTTIPPPRPFRSLRQGARQGSGDRFSEKPMTVNAIIGRAQEAEQEFSLSLSKSPLDVLLTAPEDLEDDDDEVSFCDSTLEAGLSTRTVSLESMPSLSDSFATGTVSSCDSPRTPARGSSGRRLRPTRRSLTPVSSPPGELESDPLSVRGDDGGSDSDGDMDSLDFRVFQPAPDPLAKTTEARFPLQPLRSAFKSNLTASLRALRNAARSFSSLNLTSIPPEDFLTRSILTIDPRIPYTDERRPPPLEEEPSAALRRYLNPTTRARIDPQVSAAQVLSAAQALSPALASASLAPIPARTVGPSMMGSSSSSSGGGPSSGSAAPSRSAFTASIQMQTYRVHRSRSGSGLSSAAARGSSGSSPPGRSSSSSASSSSPALLDDRPLPGPRQRELRENSDFIRIAVMEMAMRRVGKLDDRKPGRARLALPPRKMGSKPYAVGADGVPARWVAVACSDSD